MFAFLSGLPRTGSTLLSAILSQNPDIHSEGQSAVCQLMWDLHVSCGTEFSSKAMAANNRTATQDDLVRALPAIYYKDVTASNIVDKCRSWTLPANVELIRRYITDDPKIIVMTRPLDEIVASFVNLRKANGWQGDPEADLWEPDTEPITRPLLGVQYAQAHNTGEYLFVEYADLVDDAPGVVAAIYEFMGWEPFQHHYTNITHPHPEDDTVWDFPGLHDIRPEIGRRQWRTLHA
jgi:sulfotransferase